MSEKSRSIEEKKLEQALFDQSKKLRQDRQSGKTIKTAVALAKAIADAGTSSANGTKQKMPLTGKLAQVLALQKALLPTLVKKGRGQYKANLGAPAKPISGNHQTFGRASPSSKNKGKTAAPTSRPKMNSGGVSFHFKHTFISKNMAGSRDPNAKAAGTASAHQRYLERKDAPEREEGTASAHQHYMERKDAPERGAGPIPGHSVDPEDAHDAEICRPGKPLEVGNIGSTFQERFDFWERVERNERQGIERGGRVQCNIILELPHELSGQERLQILQEFARIFEERQLPHYGVIHKPDDNNDSRNYHAHFAYYDRPSRKLENGTWDFEDPDTRQNKDRESQGAPWVRSLRHRYSEIANRVLEKAGAEKRYDPRSFKDGGVDKIPEKHLGPKLAAMERQGYASTEGVHNGTVDAADHLAQIIERSKKNRHRVIQRIAPVRSVLDLAQGVGDEMVVAEAKELRQLTADYLLIERFLIGHTRRKALHQARKRIELARPYQTSKWAAKELESIDAVIAKRGLDPKTKKRRFGIYRRKKEAEEALSEIDRRYETDWIKLEGLDRKAEAYRLENAQILSKMDTSKKVLDARLSSFEIRREIAQKVKQVQDNVAAARDTATRTSAPAGAEATETATPARQRLGQNRVRIRATLPGLGGSLAKGMKDGTTSSGTGHENELSSQKAAEQLSENSVSANHTPPSAAKKKPPFNLTRKPGFSLK